MLTEEAHHLFVGETGVAAPRADEAGSQRRRAEARRHPARLIQKYINYWFTLLARPVRRRDLEQRRRRYFAAGLKGRYREEEKYSDHKALGETVRFEVFEDGALKQKEVPYRNALNEVLREGWPAARAEVTSTRRVRRRG
jgi:benzoyl-CoA 2,3-dioxygenase component B